MGGIRITIEVDGKEFPITPDGIDAAERAAHIASGLPDPSPAAVRAADGLDRAQLLSALEEAHRTHHDAVEANKRANDLLRERTIERDHFKDDSLLWSLIVAKFVDDEGGELTVRRDEINAYMGQMLEAKGEDGWVHVTLEPRPRASEEGTIG
jgi:hypothetical protein